MRGLIYTLAIFGVGFACSVLFTGNYLLRAILGAAFGFAMPLASLKSMPEPPKRYVPPQHQFEMPEGGLYAVFTLIAVGMAYFLWEAFHADMLSRLSRGMASLTMFMLGGGAGIVPASMFLIFRHYRKYRQ